MLSRWILAVSFCVSASPSSAQIGAAWPTPTFVGADTHPQSHIPARKFSFNYMTAEEMKSRVASLTGFEHPAFDLYADVIGRYDPISGLRTNDRPTLVTVLFMQRVAGEIAAAVVEREQFLDDDERIVFTGVDLEAQPDDATLHAYLDALYAAWLSAALPPSTFEALRTVFRDVERESGAAPAFRELLAFVLQHGGLYYF